MLLIAQPKSASTSLMRTIAEIAGIGHQNGKNKVAGDVKCPGFSETQKYHGTTVLRTFDYINNHINNRKSIYKEHILPCERHLEILKKTSGNFVVLLRNPDEVIDAYKRIFDVIKLDIDMKMLYNECREFYSVYKNADLKNMLIVEYYDLIVNFEKVINQILEHFNIDKKNKFDSLLKYNYTGIGLERIKNEIHS